MTETASLVVEVSSKGVKTATDDLKKLGGVSKDAESRVKSFGTAVGSLAAAFAGGAFFKSVIANTIESEDALAQLNATLKSTGEAAGLSSEEVVAMAEGLAKVTTFGDDAIISMESQLLTFTKIGKTVVPQATEAILDLATKMGGDLKGAAVQVGKALNDPVQGISALTKVGVTFNDAQKETIKALVETGDVAGAQKIILAELAVEFGGSARAARDTFGGALTSLQNSLGDLLEGGGGNLNDAKVAVEGLNEAISDPAVKEAFATITAGMLNVAAAAANALPELVSFSKWAAETLGLSAREGTSQLVYLSDEITKIDGLLKAREGQSGLSSWFSSGSTEAMKTQLAGLNVQYAEALDFEEQRAIAAADDLKTKNQLVPVVATVTEGIKTKTAADKSAASASSAAASAAASHAKALGDQVSALEFQASVVGKTSDQVTLLKLALDGATESQLASAQAALGTVSAYEAQAEAASTAKKAEDDKAQRGKAITQESLSDIEVLAQKQQGYYDALQEGSITQDTFNKVSAKNSEAMKGVAFGAQEATGALDDFAKTAQENIQSQLADNLTNGFQGSFKDILSGWGQLVQRMIAEAAAAQLTSSLFGALGVGGSAGGAGGGASGGAAGGAGALAGIGSFFAGFFDNGGNIPGGKFGVVGEKGPELVRGPATVTGREDTARMQGGNTIIINQPGVSSTREAERSAGATRRAVMGAVNSGSRYV